MLSPLIHAKTTRVLFGREETPPRWKFCVSYVNGNLGNAVGAMFVEKYFDENSKHDVSSLTKIALKPTNICKPQTADPSSAKNHFVTIP